MSNGPTLIGDASATVPGWHVVFDHALGANTVRRTRMLQGPRSSLDNALEAVAGEVEVETLEPSSSPGSGWATIRVVYRTITDSLVPGERRQPLYALAAMMDTIDIRAHPQLVTVQKHMPTIEKMVLAGDLAGIAAAYAGNDLALKFARIWVAGVTHFDRPAFALTVTRYYANPPNLTTDYAAINKVYLWADVKTDGKSIPAGITQPFWRDVNAVQKPFEWRLASVAPNYAERGENVVTWQFSGRESWAKWLYSGGSWEPGALT